MKPISLEMLKPETAEFYLRKTDKTYKLNSVSMDDERWMAATFGADLENVFKELRMKEICQIVYRLLSDEDKRDFLAKEVSEIDEQGEEKKYRVGGVDLLYRCISGIPEKIVIIKALMQTIGISRPLQDQIESEEKKSQEILSEKYAGQPSSISSQANTDGLGITSGSSPLGKSTLPSEESTNAPAGN